MEVSSSFLPPLEKMNSAQLAHLYNAMFMVTVPDEMVSASMESVCGRDARIIHRSQVLPVLQEVHDRRVFEESAYWDFRALVMNENQTLSVKDALLFLRVVHADKFSTSLWEQFLGSRADPGADVSWFEIKPWACSIPKEGRVLSQSECKRLEDVIESTARQRDKDLIRQYDDKNKTKHAKNGFEQSQKIKKKAENKVNIWEQAGLGPFLADDDEEFESSANWLKKDKVVPSDILELIDQKYSRLRQKLLELMVRLFSGEITWEILSDAECDDLVNDLIAEERRLRLSGVLPNQSQELPGADIASDSTFCSLDALMGAIETIGKGKRNSKMPRSKDYWQQMSARRHNLGQHLIDLLSRFNQEIQIYKSSVKKSREGKSDNEVYFCQLHRQLIILESHPDFCSSALAVGLAERSSKIQHQDVDRTRHEQLSSEQMSAHHGVSKPAAISAMSAAELNALNDRDIVILLVKQIYERHKAESEVMIKMLRHRTSKSHKSSQAILSKEEVIRQLTILGNQRTTWRDAIDEFKSMQREDHVRILQQALSIYYEAEARPMFAEHGRTTDEELNASVLYLLQRKQGEEFDSVIDEISRKKKTSLIEILKNEEAATSFEYCDNIASMLFGSVECSALDKLYVENLTRKYVAIRHQLINYSLYKKFGDSWYSRSIDDQQRHIAKLAIELKDLQDQGKIAAMDALVADTVQNISIYQCLGENRMLFEKRMASEQPHSAEVSPKEGGVFAELQNRYFGEYASVLEHAHQAGDVEPKILLALLRTETFIIEQSGDLRVACFLVGLFERIGGVISKRHAEDSIRLGNLAKCLVSSHQLLWRLYGKLPKAKTDIYCDNNSSLSLWVEGVLKELFLKHADERSTMLTILLDDGLKELREVADLETKEGQHKRLVALQNKQRWLLFDTAGARDDNIAILEEAAAIQMCLLYESLIDSNQPADTESIAALLTERLLQIQEKELAFLLQTINGASKEELMKLHSDEVENRSFESCRNVTKALTSYTGAWSDELIFSEIEIKYSHLESLMLESVLRKSHANWESLPAGRKSTLCEELKEETNKHRISGNVEALVKLYSSSFTDENVFFGLFGENLFDFSRKIVDFLPIGNIPIPKEIYSVTEDVVLAKDPLSALSQRKEDEKQSYQNLLRGMYDVFLGDQGRAAEVIKLRNHQSLIKCSKDFVSTARKLSLKERSQLVTHITKGSGDLRMMSVGDWRRVLAVSAQTHEYGDLSLENIPDVTGQSASNAELFVDTVSNYLRRQKQEKDILRNIMGRLPLKYKEDASMSPFDEKLQELGRIWQQNSTRVIWSDVDINLACSLKMQLWEEFNSDDTPNNYVMAELEEKQLFELSNVIYSFANVPVEDLEKQRESFSNGSYQCIYQALTDTCHFILSPTDQISQAMENKYDALKDKLLLEALMKQLGDDEWSRLSEQERQRRLLELKFKERQLRQQGKYDEAADLINKHLKDSKALREMFADERAEFERRMKERLARRKQRIEEGMSEEEADQLERQEALSDEEEMKSKKKDAVKCLDNKWKQELDDVMNELKRYNNAEEKERREQEELARIRRDQRHIKQEDHYGAAAVLMKLADGQMRSAEESRKLQEQLARERVAARRHAAKDKQSVEGEEVPTPKSDDFIPLMEAVLSELELRHLEERELLLRLSERAPSTEYYQQMLNTSKAAQEVKLTDLSDQRRHLRDSAFSDKEQEIILQEGVCYKLQLKTGDLKDEGAPHERDDVIASLLADLQQLQVQDLVTVNKVITNKTAKSLREMKEMQATARKNNWHDNVAIAVLTIGSISDALNPEQEMINALNQKYDTLKDKLILEGLMNQMGEAEWSALNERQKQQKLMELKMQEKRLRSEGKLDEARQLIKDLVDAEQGIDSMKADQERMLRERAEKLRKRLESHSGDETTKQELEEVEQKLKRTSVLDNLEYELESEKERLLALLHSQRDEATAERMKQLEMAKLRRQKKLLKREGELDEASALIHLARKNEENRLAGLGTDKEMQMELARRRLAARRERLAAGTQPKEAPSSSHMDSNVKVQDRVLEALEKKHSAEVNILIGLLTSAEDEDFLEQVNYISNARLRKALGDIESQCNTLQAVCKTQSGDCSKEKAELEKLLNKAFVYHLKVDLRSLYGDQINEYTPERVRELCTALLAQLQENQENETSSTNDLMITEEDAVLEKLADAYNSATDKGQYNNLISTLFAILDDEKKWSEQATLDSINEKFEKDKQELIDAIEAGEDVIEKDGKMYEAQELLKKLEAEHAAQKNAFDVQKLKQDEMMKARRRSRKQARFEDSCNVARQLLEEAEADRTSHQTAQEESKSKQGDMMKERLARRRAARVRQEELERQDELERNVRPKTAKDAFGHVMHAVPPIMAMKRERTVVQVSDEQKEQELKKLMKEKGHADKHESQEQRKQEEMMRAKREQRKMRKHSEVEAIFSLGERQKTMFERSSSENREKQQNMVKERIARIHNEKTQTGRPTRKSTSFEHLVDSSAQGGSKDEQMKALAANLQKRFADESQGVKEGKAPLNIGAEANAELSQPTRILSQEEKQKILKERRLAKRKNKELAEAPATTPSNDQ